MNGYKFYEELVFKGNFDVRRIRGKNEYEVFQNYIRDLPRSTMQDFFAHSFAEGDLKVKNDARSNRLRRKGNLVYGIKDFSSSLALYTKSLGYATYNGQAYALALANRSAVYFTLGDYKDCVQDIDLCLKAQYPNELLPKLFIRKAECLQKLGQLEETHKVIKEALDFIDSATDLAAANINNYKERLDDITKAKENTTEPQDNTIAVPTFERNPNFLNASAAVAIQYNRKVGRHVIATKDIAQGDVLFVEKVYAFSPFLANDKLVLKKHCQNCMVKLSSCMPCKKCVKYLYCSEKCRDDAWEEFHQWECLAIQADLFSLIHDAHLPLRIVVKAARSGFLTTSSKAEQDLINYGNADDNYPYVYNLCTHFANIKKKRVMILASYAAILTKYLSEKTNFIEWMQSQPAFAGKSSSDLLNKLGGLLIRHCAQVHCNELTMKDLNEENTRSKMFFTVLPSVMMMSHSCVPNVSYYFVRDTIVVKAMKDIKANEQLYYAYMDLSYSSIYRSVRQTHLKEVFQFNCICSACTDGKNDVGGFDSYLCVECRGPARFDVDAQFQKYVCLDCRCQFELSAEVTAKELLLEEYVSRFTSKYHNIKDANRALELCRSIFHPLHKRIGDIYLAQMNYHLTRSANLQEYMKLGQKLLEYMNRRCGASSFKTCIALYNLISDLLRALTERHWTISKPLLDELLQEIEGFVEELKKLMNLHHPSYLPFVKKMEEIISGIQVKQPITLPWICGHCDRNRLQCHCSSPGTDGDIE